MNEDFMSDWKRIGLDFKSPFDILDKPRAEPAPPKPKKKKARTQKERVMASLEDLPKTNHFNTDIMTREESDRTISIRMGVV